MGILAIIFKDLENTDFELHESGHFLLRLKEKKCISQFSSTANTKEKTKLATWTKLKEYCELGNAAFQTENHFIFTVRIPG